MQLAKAMEALPEDATVHELIRTVAVLSPDRARTLIQEDMHRDVEGREVETKIEKSEYQKKLLLHDIKELQAKRAVLQRKLDEGCNLDLEVELAKATRENQELRAEYNYVCDL